MDILSALAGGDRRSIGRVSAVVPFVLDHPEQLPVLIDGMESEDERMVVTVAGEAVAQNKTSEFDWVFTCTETRSQSVSEQAFRNPLTTT